MIRTVVCATATALAIGAVPVSADEFTDVVEDALEAYRDGDVSAAREDLDYALKLLRAMKAETLAGFLPEPEPGWTREAADADDAGGMAMFGGGTTAAARYSDGSSDFTIALVANSPMVSGIGGMLTGMASLAGGKPVRIQRVEFVDNEGDLQGVVDGRVLVSVSGNAELDAKTAHLEKMDLRKLGDF